MLPPPARRRRPWRAGVLSLAIVSLFLLACKQAAADVDEDLLVRAWEKFGFGGCGLCGAQPRGGLIMPSLSVRTYIHADAGLALERLPPG